MRILHFSDVHLSNDKKAAVVTLRDRMIEKLEAIQTQSSSRIDLVVFSGDFLDKCGYDSDGNSYANLREGLEDFDKIFITPLMEKLGLSKDRFIMTMGNHEVVRKSVPQEDKNILQTQDRDGRFDDFYWRIISKDSIPWIEDYKLFERDYYADNIDVDSLHTYNQDKLEAYHTININGQVVNIASLYTTWATCTEEEFVFIHREQLSKFRGKVKSSLRAINIIFGHNHYQDIADIKQRTAICNDITSFANICFSGHTHEGADRGVDTDKGYTYFNIAPGMNQRNMRRRECDYCNGFMIVEYDMYNKWRSNEWYEQQDNGEFELKSSYGENGISRKPLSTLRRIEPISNFLCKSDDWQGPYLRNDKILELQKKIVSGPQIIRLSALPGFGKSRLIYEAYSDKAIPVDKSKVYYCESGENEEEIYTEFTNLICVSSQNVDTIIIDDCPLDLLARCSSYILKYQYNVRLIGVSNQPYDYRYIPECEDCRLEATDLKDEVNLYIQQNVELRSASGEVVREIQTLADGFPFMATLLVQAYNESNTIGIGNIQHLIAKLLQDSHCEDPESQNHAMRAMALFQPMPTEIGNEKAYNYITETEEITHIAGKSKYEINRIFKQTRNRLRGTLIEETDSWLNVRPFPLAVYLVSQWFEEMRPEWLKQLIDHIQALPPDMKNVIGDGMGKRIGMMQDNEVAQDAIAKLMSIPNGSFCCEEVVCSEMGSRLFLAMCTVNPEKVAACLRYLFKDKSTNWLRNNVKDDVRRNLVWALNKLCFAHESYNDAVVVLTQFAEAENERWANNSKSSLMQLFPIQLPDTEVDLRTRSNTIARIWNAGYKSLALNAINIAFRNSNFVRMGGAESFGWHHREPHVPRNNEIHEYWDRCLDMLLTWYDQDKSILADVCDIAESHIFDWRNYYYMEKYLFQIIDAVSPEIKGNWKKMYELLSHAMRHHREEYNAEHQQTIDSYIERLKPQLFADTLLYTGRRVFDHVGRDVDVYEKAHELLAPLAKEFVSRGIYQDETEIKALLSMREGEGLFMKELKEVLSEEQLIQLLEIVWDSVEEQKDEFNSSFINGILVTFKESTIVKSFIERLLDNGYKIAYVRAMAAVEDNEMHSYLHLLSLCQNNLLSYEDVEVYMASLWGLTNEQMIIILPSLIEHFPDKYDSILPFVMRHRYGTDALGSDLHVYVRKLLLETRWVNDNGYCNYDEIQLIKAYLEKFKETDVDFGVEVNRKAIAITSKICVHNDGIGELYEELLQEPYQSAIWDDFSEAIVDNIGFFISVQYAIGSGFGFGEGSLFKYVPEQKLKALCEKGENAIHNLACMAPVFKYAENGEIIGLSDFLTWLIDAYGNLQATMAGISANMHTMSWTGSTIPLHEDMIRVLTPYLTHEYDMIQEWAKTEIVSLNQDIAREKSQEDYMRMHYN